MCAPPLACNAMGFCEPCEEANCEGAPCFQDNGCGGTCGCPEGETCDMQTGTCSDPDCVPDCEGKDCGPDGCGGMCGICEDGFACEDTTCVPATPCTEVADCGPMQGCDPFLQECVDGCEDSSDCPDGYCVTQDETEGIGACVPACMPKNGGCDAGSCIPLDFIGLAGLCFPAGDGAEGESCGSNPIHTDCQGGMACAFDGPGGESVCRHLCDFWGDGPAMCPAGQYCSFLGLCTENLLTVDPADIGGTCVTPDALCGEADGKLLGVCEANDACTRLCRRDIDECEVEGEDCIQSAASAFNNALGACCQLVCD